MPPPKTFAPLSSDGSILTASTPWANATRDTIFAEAVESLTRCNTPWAIALRELLASEATPDPLPIPKVVVVVSETPTAPVPTRGRPTGQNVTAQWLAANATRVWQSLTTHLATKMQRSGELGVVEDHVQEFLTRLIEDDRLADFLAKGENPKLSALRVWAFHSAVRQIRHWGVDAALRATCNAKTAREVAKGEDFKPVQSATAAREIVPHMDDGDGTGDITDPMAATPEDVSSSMSRVEYVRRTLMRRGQAHLIPAVNGLLEGLTLAEIQSTYNVSEGQIATALRNVRAA